MKYSILAVLASSSIAVTAAKHHHMNPSSTLHSDHHHLRQVENANDLIISSLNYTDANAYRLAHHEYTHHNIGNIQNVQNREWSEFVTLDNTQCMDGRPTGYYYRKGPETDGALSTKLVVFLMGGGACFNSFCDVIATSEPNGGGAPGTGGIFSTTNDDNPMKDFTYVYLPYCTGDVFIGDGEANVAGQKQFRGYTHVHETMKHFFANSESFLDRHLTKFVLTGESAGGFGAVANYHHIRSTFVTSSDSKGDYWFSDDNIMISDSGMPLPNNALLPCLQSDWIAKWGAEQQIRDACDDCITNGNIDGPGLTNIVEALRSKYPNDRLAFLSTTQDAVIAAFFAFGRSPWPFSCGSMPDLNVLAWPNHFRDGLVDFWVRTKNEKNICHYFFGGAGHTHTGRNVFFQTTHAVDDNDGHGQRDVYLHDWYLNVVNGTPDWDCQVESGLD